MQIPDIRKYQDASMLLRASALELKQAQHPPITYTVRAKLESAIAWQCQILQGRCTIFLRRWGRLPGNIQPGHVTAWHVLIQGCLDRKQKNAETNKPV